MNGMHCESHALYTTGGDFYSTSHHYELPPTPTIAQLSMVNDYEFDDQAKFDLGFTRVEFLDGKVTRHANFPDIDSVNPTSIVVQNGMTRVDWGAQVSNCAVSYIVNLFYWSSVS